MPVLVKLDRVLCSVDWEQLFPNSLLHSAATEDSDHCPLLGLDDSLPGKRRIHFESYWPKVDSFLSAVEAWNSLQASSCRFDMLSHRLNATARKLQSWSHKTVGHVNSQIELAREVLHQLEIAQDFRILAPGEDWLKKSLKKHCLALASFKRTIARSHSRISWLSDGDANTKLFTLATTRERILLLSLFLKIRCSLVMMTRLSWFMNSMMVCWDLISIETSLLILMN